MIAELFYGFDHVLMEVTFAIIPLLVFFFVFQFFFLKLEKERIKNILIGVAFTFAGLALFLQGVEVGFFPAGQAIGELLAERDNTIVLLPALGFLFGFVATFAEPAIRILNYEVEKVTAGSISKNVMLLTLSTGVAVAIMLSMIRIVLGIPLMYFIIPGYLLAVVLVFISSDRFISIAFDAGGVATGPMTVTFIMAIAVGIADVTQDRDPLLDGFGMIALVALMPILSVLILGLIFNMKERVRE
ncbi:DUF1538 domain-containing protein [Salisediminibacterium halotolerans]|uniref:DUF1538 domain-containing protein n=1 Tax=Salisediminibacterium halotolerans TaxID=517425 RepID=UPI000EB2BAB9|nr:DUF1538 domain-containing protein [Salisediminibacterium halotolerans]RLJ72351.1 uncharacterized protein DUF1538 [Actinophytocola xinjiangensis]RPE85565.1 uncharacterized protein DUF1538 [Salisediminibacterium halotolerans]TWG33520.1 uncharacterized protein DUF1538 [Salisediminibacterium halotolerans]GEL08531.1 hypothetical protein SHA02_19470 [Salisediminibacterium halotolerans]